MSIAQINLAQCGKYAQVIEKIYLDLEGLIPNLPTTADGHQPHIRTRHTKALAATARQRTEATPFVVPEIPTPREPIGDSRAINKPL